MFTARKKNGKPRRAVDMQVLNKHTVRETHHTQSPFHQAMLVLSGTKKTITDVWNGYHSVPIREEERHLTAFIHHALVPIKSCPGATRLHRTDSPEKLSMPFSRKVNASMTHGYGQTSRRMLFSNMSLAGRLRSTRNCPESRKVCNWLRHYGTCWLRHNSDQYPTQ